ncbi:hypothetical protein [Rathayibacter soli]|uniref:hypothetical protein n=1 Tax=Rathayibacter soli TaxID=3144168 RepID=UPI0027E3F935|nr:hypothetical protein [Glaciibacter superstes]
MTGSASEQRRKGRLGFATWLGFGLSAFAIIVGSVSGGFGGMLLTAGLIALGTAIYALTTRRSSWLHLPTAHVTVASLSIAALMLTGFGSILFGATHSPVEAPVTMVTPSASPKSEAPLVVVQPEAPASVVETSAPVTRPTALAALAALAIKGRAPMTGYQRTTNFGVGWLDVDRNGCDTRNDILARDLSKLQRSGSCKVLSGVLDDPYTG